MWATRQPGPAFIVTCLLLCIVPLRSEELAAGATGAGVQSKPHEGKCTAGDNCQQAASKGGGGGGEGSKEGKGTASAEGDDGAMSIEEFYANNEFSQGGAAVTKGDLAAALVHYRKAYQHFPGDDADPCPQNPPRVVAALGRTTSTSPLISARCVPGRHVCGTL